MMHLTAASLGLVSLLLPATAEARPRNATMRQKIMEKLEELRQKAGLSKPKEEDEEKKPKEETKDKNPKLEDKAEDKKSNPISEAEEKKAKLKDEAEEEKPKLKDNGDEKKPEAAQPHPKAFPSIPGLPNILNDITV
ncbi:UNVERIFIED_CONTAM: hypothetical protein Sradi_1829900 [Sesamum radiatum]|uniref:Uncharacterized protein n=1 Tax=Sesamum radiatum TaxID=300843 RepID=A0AAW2TVF9_SESRA